MNWPLELFIGFRYLKSRRSETFISLITILALAGVTLGVTALIVVIAVMSGAEADLQQRILAVQPQIMVLRHGGTIPGYAMLMEKLRAREDVTAVAPFIYTPAMLRSAKTLQSVIIKGIDPALDKSVVAQRIGSQIGDGSPPLESGRRTPPIVLGKVLAKNLKVTTGDTVYMVSNQQTASPRNLPPLQRLHVAGVFDSGMHDFDKSYAGLHLADAQHLLGLEDQVTGLELQVADLFQAPVIARSIGEQLKFPFWTRDWIELNHNVFTSLKLQKAVMFVILSLIVLVAAFSITSTLVMLVKEKTYEIAILKALGATPARIRKIFIFKGMLICGLGTTLGSIAGCLLSLFLKRFPLIELPADVYYFTSLPIRLQWTDVLVIVVSTFVISLLATLFPAWQAANLRPVDGLRQT